MIEKIITEEKIGHLELDPPLCIQTGTAVGEVLSQMQQQRRSCVLICRGGRCVGIFTERDYLHKILGTNTRLTLPVDDFMSTNPKSLKLDDTLGQAIQIMHEHGYRNIPLVDQKGNCSGLLQIRDIIDFLAELYPEEVLNAPPLEQRFMEPDGA